MPHVKFRLHESSPKKDKQTCPLNCLEMAKRTSLLARLVHESDLISDYNFDREEVRQVLVNQKSFFKAANAIQRAFQDERILFKQISGHT